MLTAQPLPTPLSIPQYALQAGETNRFSSQQQELEFLRLGYFGEIGGLLAVVKKTVRDQLSETQHELAAEELGDALWYLVAAAGRLGISPDDLGAHALATLRKNFKESELPPPQPVTFRHLDGLVQSHRDYLVSDRSEWLGRIAQSAGVIAQTTDEQFRGMARPAVAQHFGLALAIWAQVCGSFDLRSEDVARENLQKIRSRWPGDNPVYPDFFDPESKYEAHERFPRVLPIRFVERGNQRDGHVVQMIGDVFVGDRLTDNSNEPDDYRFHDVFHLAYIAHLGWSPVMRGLLKRKRKSEPKIDENEDGARAMIIEEGIATWIFNHAKRRGLYRDVRPGGLDYSLLKQIHSMVQGYEVYRCELWQWERAILDGFAIFRELQQHRGGTVEVDMLNHKLNFLAPP
ncbi:nucleoside triphosphate pyrophosphohydrolase family protein [Frateuria sp. GZRe12]|uniref:nucleoside triphosphate pyrophosphohydrolase family protein n=1 Tax=Frateuria sp. GZRe12 TaxID=3351533 RepID=UPI003EDC6D74